jgi:hypothetical protein
VNKKLWKKNRNKCLRTFRNIIFGHGILRNFNFNYWTYKSVEAALVLWYILFLKPIQAFGPTPKLEHCSEWLHHLGKKAPIKCVCIYIYLTMLYQKGE